MPPGDLRDIIATVVAALGPAGILGWWLMLRKDRREDSVDLRDGTASEVSLVMVLIEGQAKMQGQIADLFTRWSKAETAAADARAEASSARHEAARAVAEAAEAIREVALLRSSLSRVVAHFRPVLDWIDSGAHPPPPVIPPDVRDIIARADRSPTAGDTLA